MLSIKINLSNKIIFLLLFLSSSTFSQNFEVIFMADGKYAQDLNWLTNIQNNWGATGINLRIYRSIVDQGGLENVNGKFQWNNKNYGVDKPIETILTKTNLDLYIRVNLTMYLYKNAKYYSYSQEDIHIRRNGKPFLNYHTGGKDKILNITSNKARTHLLDFFSVVVNHIDELILELSNKHNENYTDYKNRIKLIVPTISFADETEYPFATAVEDGKKLNYQLTGYSKPEQDSFMVFLEKKYGNVSNLIGRWKDEEISVNASFNSKDIDITRYNWDGINEKYDCEVGRKDFLDFRKKELVDFIKDCSQIVRGANYKFGIQLGSIYDDNVDFRGYYDPSDLFHFVDCAITGDILEFAPNFNFSANYLKSLCELGTDFQKDNFNYSDTVKFITETNEPGYGNYDSTTLIKYWEKQLESFYIAGASAIFLSHWGTISLKQNADYISNNSLVGYDAWGKILKKYNKLNVQKDIDKDEMSLKKSEKPYSNIITNLEYKFSRDKRKETQIEGIPFVTFPHVKVMTNDSVKKEKQEVDSLRQIQLHENKTIPNKDCWLW